MSSSVGVGVCGLLRSPSGEVVEVLTEQSPRPTPLPRPIGHVSSPCKPTTPFQLYISCRDPKHTCRGAGFLERASGEAPFPTVAPACPPSSPQAPWGRSNVLIITHPPLPTSKCAPLCTRQELGAAFRPGEKVLVKSTHLVADPSGSWFQVTPGKSLVYTGDQSSHLQNGCD